MTTAVPPVPVADVRTGRRLPAGWLWYGGLALGMAVGAGCFLYQWSNGLGVTGLSNTVSWGLYIITFMFLVGISAGGLIVVAGSELFGTHRLESLNRLAVICSGTAVVGAAISIAPDLGRPQLFWKMLVQPNVTSPLVWDMVILSVYLAIAGIDLWILTRSRVSSVTMRHMAQITLPVAVLVHSITAWIFGLMVARPFWNTALMAPLFISSALVSGTALVLVVAHVADRRTSWSPPSHVFGDLARLLVWFIAVDAFLLFTEVLTTYASNVPDHVDQLNVVLFGRLAPVFWAEVLLGVVVPFMIFSRPSLRDRRGWLVAGAVLAVLGVFFKRVNILMSAMFEPLVGLAPGIPGGRPGQGFRPDQVYVPTWVEWGVVLGIAAALALLVTVGVQRLVVTRSSGSR